MSDTLLWDALTRRNQYALSQSPVVAALPKGRLLEDVDGRVRLLNRDVAAACTPNRVRMVRGMIFVRSA